MSSKRRRRGDELVSEYRPSVVDRAEIRNRFSYHALKKGQASRLTDMREYIGMIADAILQECPVGREREYALARLEEASFWCEASVTRNE